MDETRILFEFGERGYYSAHLDDRVVRNSLQPRRRRPLVSALTTPDVPGTCRTWLRTTLSGHDSEESYETIVFDAEPFVAYFCDEPGSDTVEKYIDAVEGAADGYISAVNLAEMHYIVRSIDGEERAGAVVDVLQETGIRRVDTEETWPLAADFKFTYSPALGDAFALGTAAHVDGTLLVGADDDDDDITEVSIARFRVESV